MAFSRLPVEINDHIFEELALSYTPRDILHIRLISSSFAQHLFSAYLRNDACFKRYLTAWGDRTFRGHWSRLTQEYIVQGLVTSRPFVSEPGYSYGMLDELRCLLSLIQSRLPLSDESARWSMARSLVERFTYWAEAPQVIIPEDLSSRSRSPAGIDADREYHDLLSAAAMFGSEEVVQKLMKRGIIIIPNQLSIHETTGRLLGNAAACAAWAGRLDILKLLLGTASKPDQWLQISPDAGTEILNSALIARQYECAEYLLRKDVGLPLLGPASLHIFRPLVKAGDLPRIRQILEHVFEPFAAWQPNDHEGRAPIWSDHLRYICHEACRCGRKDVVEFALDHGAGSTEIDQFTTLKLAADAISNRNLEILHLILNRCDTTLLIGGTARGYSGLQPLCGAVDGGHHSAVRALLDLGVSPDTVDVEYIRNGQTPLRVATRNGLTSTVALLLEHGATLPKSNYLSEEEVELRFFGRGFWSQAQLMCSAVRSKDPEMVRVLGQYGVAPNWARNLRNSHVAETDLRKYDPMFAALDLDTVADSRAMVDVLVELGAPDPGDCDAETYLAIRAFEINEQ